MKTSRWPALTPELLQRILPALRMLVRYPTRPAKVVSFETGIELDDIYAYTETQGRPKAKDIERIEAQLAEGEAPKPVPVAKKSQGDTDQSIAAHARPEKNVAPAEPWQGKTLRTTAYAKYRAVLEALVKKADCKAAYAICREHGVRFSGLASFHRTYFGELSMAALNADKVRAFIAWADRQVSARIEQPGAPKPAAFQRGLLQKMERIFAADRPDAAGVNLGSSPSDSARNTIDAVAAIRARFDAEVTAACERQNALERDLLVAKAKRDAADEILLALQRSAA